MQTNFLKLNFQRGGNYVKTAAKYIFHVAVDSSEQTGRLINAGTVILGQKSIVSKH